MENEISQLVSQTGFPIAVAIWMLVKSSKDNELMRQTIIELTLVCKSISERIDKK